MIGLSVVLAFFSFCTTTAYALSPLKKLSLLGTPLAPSLLGDTIPEIMFSASIFVTASVFQFFFNLLDVLICPVTCALLCVLLALPIPTLVKSSAFVTRSLILLRASLRKTCNVNELVVIEPTKNLEPSGIGSPPSTIGSALLVLPSDSVFNLIASPVVYPCASITTLLSVMLTVFLVKL